MPRYLSPLPVIPDDPVAIAAMIGVLHLINLGAQATPADCHDVDEVLMQLKARDPKFEQELQDWHFLNA